MTLHVPIPLDIELFHLQYPKDSTLPKQDRPKEFALIGSLESDAWDGLRILDDGGLSTPEGRMLHFYPVPIVVRVTASLQPPHLNPEDVNESDLAAPARVDDLLSRLRFVMRINRNLHQWLHPVRDVRNIGAPKGDAFPERTYEIVYRPRTPIPLDDIVCLDVFGPQGTHLAKFYLPLFRKNAGQ